MTLNFGNISDTFPDSLQSCLCKRLRPGHNRVGNDRNDSGKEKTGFNDWELLDRSI